VPKDESNTNEVVYFLLGITRLGQQQDTGIWKELKCLKSYHRSLWQPKDLTTTLLRNEGEQNTERGAGILDTAARRHSSHSLLFMHPDHKTRPSISCLKFRCNTPS
jgi:hypothetical protein